MSRQTALALIAITSVLAADHVASAQVVAYHHRSTVWGDHLAGASELVRAQGAFLKDEAEAASTWVNVAAAHDQLQYQRAEHHYGKKMMRLEYIKQKASDRREQQAEESRIEQIAAVELWQSARRGFVAWPLALKRADYAQSVVLLESILRTWTPENPSAEAYRRALATEAGVLRSRIATDTAIDFTSRVAAVKTLDRVQRLAEMDVAESRDALLAMR
jgi:hypothetical protein